MSKRMSHFKAGAMESPRTKPKPKPQPKNTGESSLAIQSKKAWDAKDRPQGWVNKVYGLVVHTTGRGLPEKAYKARQYPTVRAVNYYSQSHGCHYVCGYRGVSGGDLIQMANEREQANGVGTTDQRKSIVSGSWEKDLPATLVRRWKKRWPGYANPLDLLPGTKTCNPAYIHLECIPLIPAFEQDGEVGSEVMEGEFAGSLFTYEQYETIALLACDIALRNQWPDEWWRTPRLLGHEDLSPLTRHNKKGAWDPGFLRASPWFDWRIVMEHISADSRIDLSFDEEHYLKLPCLATRPRGHYTKY